MNLGSVTPAAIVTVLTNAVAVAVAFGVPLTHTQQTVLLVFAGSVTTLIFTVVAAVQIHHTASAVKLATTVPVPASSAASAPSAPSPPGG